MKYCLFHSAASKPLQYPSHFRIHVLTAFPHEAQNAPPETIEAPHFEQNFIVSMLRVVPGEGSFCFDSIGMVGIAAGASRPSVFCC